MERQSSQRPLSGDEVQRLKDEIKRLKDENKRLKDEIKGLKTARVPDFIGDITLGG